jgi:hypothetical protein
MYGAITWAGINVYGVCYGDSDGTQLAAWVCGDDSAAVVCGDTAADGFTAGGKTARGRTRGSSSGAGRVTGGSSKREGC